MIIRLTRASDEMRRATSMFRNVEQDGTFSGYACVFNEPDYRGDVILPGAFAATIAARGPEKIRLLYQHDETRPLGILTEMKEDEKGLFVRGKVNVETECGRDCVSLMRQGALTGMSIGADEMAYEEDEDEDENGYRKKQVGSVSLMEISIVTFPAFENAQIDSATMAADGLVALSDSLEIDGQPRRTEDGYLACFARAARTGIQVYQGKELGRPDLDKVRVYRSPEEVFSRASMHSYAHRPVTKEHPPVLVDADNWKQYSVGHTGGDVMRDREFVRVPLVLMDKDAISDYDAGRRSQLSLGYLTKIEFRTGRSPTGEEFDAVQTRIRANHLAVVTAARGGSSLRIGDASAATTERDMDPIKTARIVVDSIALDVPEHAGQVITRAIDQALGREKTLQTALDAAKARIAELEASTAKLTTDAATANQAKDAEIATLKTQLKDAAMSPEKLSQMVRDHAGVVGKAMSVLGDKLVVKDKTTAEIMRQVVDARLGDGSKGWTDDQVRISFDSLTVDVKPAQIADPIAAALDASGGHRPAQQTVDAAYTGYDKELSDRWRKPATH
jgi:HK97 family phage prohead protease